MPKDHLRSPLFAACLSVGLCLPGAAMAYGGNDAIRDCNSRLRADYSLTDFRSESAEKLPGGGHRYRVVGKTKIDGKKYGYACEIKDRRVVQIRYDGPEPKGMDTAGKIAVGAAAALAIGAAVSAMSNNNASEKPAQIRPETGPAPLVKVRSNGEMEVIVADSCTVLYNDIGLRKRYGSGCSSADLTKAKQAMNRYLAETSNVN